MFVVVGLDEEEGVLEMGVGLSLTVTESRMRTSMAEKDANMEAR